MVTARCDSGLEPEKNFRSIHDDWLADALYWLDEDGHFVHANDAGCHALGYSLEELTALSLWDVDEHMTREQWPLRDDTAFAAGGLRSVSRRKDGTVFPVEVRGRPVDLDGRTHYLTTVRDISALVKLEKEARDAERNVRAILDNVPDIAWMKDSRSRFIAVNQALAQSFGLGVEDAVGKTDYDMVSGELAARYQADDARVIASGERTCIEEPFCGGDGLPRWIETIKTPVRDSDGVIVGTVGIARDITARKLAQSGAQAIREMLEALVEERTRTLTAEIAAREAADAALLEKQALLETIIEGASAVIFVKDRDGRYLLANKRYLALGGWMREDVIGKTDFDLYPRELAEYLFANDRAVLESAGPVEFEETIDNLHGVRTYIALKVPLTNPAGVPFAVCGIATDISERKKEQAQLRQATDAAEQASRAKSDFLCVMSHELRTPLNAVIGFADALLLEYFGGLNDKQRDYIQSISRSGLHLLHIINDILDYGRVDAGRMVLHEVVVDVAALFASCRELVDTAGRRVGIEIAPGLPQLHADELRLRQIIVNLLGNAVKFTTSGASITLGAQMRADGGVSLWVRDTGIGIRPEEIPRALEMFTQIDTPINRRHQGTGIGLPLAASLAKAHGGALDIDSTVGEGTTVWIRLPPRRTLAGGEAPLSRTSVCERL
ncbi:PAS domain-containing protein [Azospirillum sp. sgz301742]